MNRIYKYISFSPLIGFILFCCLITLITFVTAKEKQDGLTFMLAGPITKINLIRNERTKWLNEGKYINIPSISKIFKNTKTKILKEGWGNKLLSEIFVEVAKDLEMREKNLNTNSIF